MVNNTLWSIQAPPELTDNEFAAWSELLEERTGIQIQPRQRSFLQTQLLLRMRELGFNDYKSYFQQVVGGIQGIVEWSFLIDRLVVKETSFFRHRPSVEYVRKHLQALINNGQLGDTFDVWSMGCATGEEPYSLAMVINDCFEFANREPYFGITATDISFTGLNHARKGSYDVRRMEQVSAQERTRYFEAVDDSHYRISDKLRERVCFTHGNVVALRDTPPVPMDVIFCQNLLIYFRKWRRRDVLNLFAERLKPGGILVVGLGEIVDWQHPDIERVNEPEIQAYRRRLN